MCYLASAKEIRSGTVPVASSSRNYCGQPYYTPETYCLHLKNILRLMEQYENYGNTAEWFCKCKPLSR